MQSKASQGHVKSVLCKLSLSQATVETLYEKSNTVKPLLSGHPRDLPKCPINRGHPLNRVCKNCAMFVDDHYSTVTLYCNKVACC